MQGHIDVAPPHNDLDYQTLEMYADQAAICVGLHNVRFRCENPSVNQMSDGYFASPAKALKIWFFALCVCCRIWGDHRSSATGESRGSDGRLCFLDTWSLFRHPIGSHDSPLIM